GVTAGEDELEALVGKRRVHRWLRLLGGREQGRLLREGLGAAQAVDRAVAGRRDEPGARVGRVAVFRPAFGGDRERLLRGCRGDIEVAEGADQGGDDATPLVAEGLVEVGHHFPSWTGRTSIPPPRRAAGILAASSIAASRSSAS